MTNLHIHIGALLLAALLIPGAPAIQPGADLRVLTYNIKHGRGNDNVVDLERTAAVIRTQKPDIVGLQEVDDRAERSGRVAEAAHLGKLLELKHAFGRFMDYQGGAYGMAILSRFPIEATEDVRLPDGNEPRVALSVRVKLPDGQPLTVVNVHFDWVRDDGFRFAQAEALTKYLDALKTPYVLLGDLTTCPSRARWRCSSLERAKQSNRSAIASRIPRLSPQRRSTTSSSPPWPPGARVKYESSTNGSRRITGRCWRCWSECDKTPQEHVEVAFHAKLGALVVLNFCDHDRAFDRLPQDICASTSGHRPCMGVRRW